MSISEITKALDRALRTRLLHGGVKVERIREMHIAAAMFLLAGGVVLVEIISLKSAPPQIVRQSLPDVSGGLVSVCIAALFWMWTRKTGTRTLGLLAYALLWGCGLSVASAACLSAILLHGK